MLRGTDLERLWQAGQCPVLSLEDYISVLERCVRALPRQVIIHRLTGDGAKRDLLAPLWSGDKKRVMNAIHAAFLRDDVEQGSRRSAHAGAETSFVRRQRHAPHCI